MTIKANIRKETAAIKQAQARVNKLLARYPEYRAEFNEIIQRHIKPGGTFIPPTYDRPITSIGATVDTTPWYESGLVSDLFDFGTKIATHERIAADEQKQLELELAQIEAKSAALDKQLKLQAALDRSSTLPKSFMNELLDSPVKLAALIGLGATWFYIRRPKKGRSRR